MNESPLNDAVARQYERFPYPAPAQSLHEWHAKSRHFPDPEQQHLLFWPDRVYTPGLDILIAGCGANQAAELAFHNPSARVLGIDVSQASLASEQRLKELHDLANLELRRLPIEEVQGLGRSFDLVISTGVLHHMSDPGLGMRALGSLLRRDGVLALMLYAKYGRYGVSVMGEFFHMLGLDQSAASVAIIKETIRHLPPPHPIRHYLALGPRDLDSDAGVIDSFLHPRAKTYSVPDILRMADAAGLAFQGWISNYLYYPENLPADSDLYRALARLPERELWAAMELFYALGNATHYFYVCRPDRPRDSYAIEFSDSRFLDYIPVPAPELQIASPAKLSRRGVECNLDPAQALAFGFVDGKRSVAEILAATRAAGAEGEPSQALTFARTFFRSLWRLELIFVRLPAPSAAAADSSNNPLSNGA